MVQKSYLKKKDVCKVKFNFKPEVAETVEIRGLNSDWNSAIVMNKKKDGSFSCDVSLPKDTTHEFKYLVDNEFWFNDETADNEVPNEFGGSNSVITV